eukprot:EG_transcript_29608
MSSRRRRARPSRRSKDAPGFPLRRLAFAFVLLSLSEALALAMVVRQGLHVFHTLMALKDVVVFFVVAVSLNNAAHSFSKVVKESGNDVDHLMAGLRSLARSLGRLFMPVAVAAVTQACSSLKEGWPGL